MIVKKSQLNIILYWTHINISKKINNFITFEIRKRERGGGYPLRIRLQGRPKPSFFIQYQSIGANKLEKQTIKLRIKMKKLNVYLQTSFLNCG